MLSRPNTCASRSRSARGVLGPVLLERLADAAGEAAGERDQAARVALEQLPVDARLRVVALEVAERAELDQVRVAGVRLGQQRQVRVAARARVAVVGDVDLAADDRLDPLVARGLVEVDRAGERAVVGERHRRHLELGRAGGERGDPARPVEDRVLAVDVQVDEVGAHGRPILRTGSRRPQFPARDRLSRRCLAAEHARAGSRGGTRAGGGARRAERRRSPSSRPGASWWLQERLAGGSLAQARHEPLREPLLLAACVERREVRVDPAIGHGCTRSPRGPSRSAPPSSER